MDSLPEIKILLMNQHISRIPNVIPNTFKYLYFFDTVLFETTLLSTSEIVFYKQINDKPLYNTF